MKKRFIFVLLCMIIVTGLLSGCGGEINKLADEKKIVADVNTMRPDEWVDEGIEITACEVIKRQTNKDEKTDFVFVKLFAENNFRKNEYQYKLTYNFYDDGGWILDEMTPENEDEWKIVYLDAEGKDMLESIVWFRNCDADDDVWRNATYLGESNGEHYVATSYDYYPEYIQFNVSNTDGDSVLYRRYDYDSAPSMLSYRGVYHNSMGELCFILSYYQGDGDFTMYMTDKNGDRISDYYDGVYAYTNTPGTLMVYKDGKYGAVDTSGTIVKELVHKNAGEVMPEWASTIKPAPEGYEPLKNIDDIMPTTGSNGVFHTYQDGHHSRIVDVNSEDIIKFEHKEAYTYRENGLIRVHENETWDEGRHFRIYDYNGNCRSPEFKFLGNSSDSPLVGYEGRVGVVPDILTDEEIYYFKYEWALEQK